MLPSLKRLHHQLDSVTRYLTPLLPLANCHMVEFLTSDHWEKLIPEKLKKSLDKCELNDAVEKFWEYAGSSSDETTELNTWIRAARSHYLSINEHCLTTDQLQDRITSWGGDIKPEIKVTEFMTSKKSYEVATMSRLVASLFSATSSSCCVEAGGGRGHLLVALCLGYGVPSLTVDCDEDKVRAAAARVTQIQKKWHAIAKRTKHGTEERVFHKSANNHCSEQHRSQKNLQSPKNPDDNVAPVNNRRNITGDILNNSGTKRSSNSDLESTFSNMQITESNRTHSISNLDSSGFKLGSDSNPLRPDTTPIRPDTSPLRPDTTPLRPDTNPLCSDTTPLRPDTNPLCPDTTPLRLDTSLHRFATAYITRDTDLASVVADKFPEYTGDIKILLTGLHTCGDLGPASLRIFASQATAAAVFNVPCCYHLLTEGDDDSGFPMSHYLRGYRLGRNARMLAAQSVERVAAERQLPARSLLHRALLQALIKTHLPNETISEGRLKRLSKCDNFQDYFKMADAMLNLRLYDRLPQSCHQQINDDMDRQWRKLVLFYLLRLCLAQVVESVVLLDRLVFLVENGFDKVYLVKLFDPVLSPRCHGIVAVR